MRRRFSKHLEAYDSLAVIQQRIARTLVEHFQPHAPLYLKNTCEVGCGTGFLTRELTGKFQISHLYLNDLVPRALPALCERLADNGFSGKVSPLPGDAEHLDIPEPLDLIASASAMQWFEELPLFFEKTARKLNSDGWFVFNVFGPENLRQIKELTGYGLEYLSSEELKKSLEHHFKILELKEETIRQEFDTPFNVLRHLQQTGVTATGEFRWTSGKLREFEQKYTERYSSGKKVYLDWEVIYVIAKKKAPLHSSF